MLGATQTCKRKSNQTAAAAAPTALANINGNLNPLSQEQPAKRKRTKLSQSGNQQQRRQSGQVQQLANDNSSNNYPQQASRRLSSGNISMSACSNSSNNNNNIAATAPGAGSTNQPADDSVWIFGLINNIEQLLTTFNAINTNSSSSSTAAAAAAALAARNGSGSSTPCSSSSSSSSSSTFSSTLSSPQSSPASANSISTVMPVQQHLSVTSAAAAAAQTLPRSPMSRQIKFHEYKGPPSSKRQQQQQQQQQQNQNHQQPQPSSSAQKQQTSISTNNINSSSTAIVAAATKQQQQHQHQQEQQAQQAKANNTADIVAVSSSPQESVKSLAQKSNRISAPTTKTSSLAICNGGDQAIPGQQQSSTSVGGSSIGLLNQATKDHMAEFGVSLHHLQQQQQQQQRHHQSLMNFHYSEPSSSSSSNGCFSAQNDPACSTNLLMPVQTQAHIFHHPQQQKDPRQQQQSLVRQVRQVRLTSGPQCGGITIQQASYAASLGSQPVSSDNMVVVGLDETTALLASPPSIETIRLNQQQQQQSQRQTIAAAGKIDPGESYHQHHNHQPHHIQQQQQHVLQQLNLQPFSSSQLQAAPSTFMIHTTGHGSSNGSFVSRQLYSPMHTTQPQQLQLQQQQTALKIQSSPMNSLATSRSAPTANAYLREQSATGNKLHRQQTQQQQQQQSIMPPQLQQQQHLLQQQQNINYRHGAAAEELFGADGQEANYNVAPLNQLDSNLINDRGYMLDDVDSLAVFGPDSEDIDACDIEPSIGFSHGSDELLFSEFIDLQDVPMNVDESDWLKKFLPPCSMS